MTVTKARLESLCPTAKPALLEAVLDNWHYAQDRGIDTPLRVQMFLATIAVETGGLRSIDESLTYTTAARLMAVWPTRFKSEAAAKPYLRNPEALAEKVYGGRLGNNRPGDGYRYRGAGFLQVTGRENFRKVGAEDHPETLRNPTTGFKAAVDHWVRTGCNEVADKDDARAMRLRVNGGTNGLAEFEGYLKKAKRIFVEIEPMPLPKPRPAPSPEPLRPIPEATEITHRDVKNTAKQGGLIAFLVAVAGCLAFILSKIFGAK